MYSKLLSVALLAMTYTVAPAKQRVISSGTGEDRAECLRQVFGASSGYNIGYIMSMTPKDNLGLYVDTSCDCDDPECVKNAVDNYDGDGDILICCEHDALTDIVEELGDDDVPEYPDDRYDSIWTHPSPYNEITAETSEQCPGLD
ncbi:uncharacterized protein BDW70DRAFT_154625 [Aspergillus foveolatus]|uniref:uncharacterized protein n=1 Tax=Aspergillus foveolatus TaxID=210207 RepID=UPI003CCE078C